MIKHIFRGKTDRGDNWVEGCLIQTPEFCGILEDEDKVHPMYYPYLDNSTGCIDGYVTTVKPETVGQWTFFIDRNGKKIFEGDIVERAHKRDGEPNRMFVAWHRGSWILLWHDDDDFLWNWCADATRNGVDIGGCIVVGNVHDNPEMLEEE